MSMKYRKDIRDDINSKLAGLLDTKLFRLNRLTPETLI